MPDRPEATGAVKEKRHKKQVRGERIGDGSNEHAC